MSVYQYRFLIIYWCSYLEEFEKACFDFLQQRFNDNAHTINELYTGKNYEIFKDYYDVVATSSIFAEKLGKHPETRTIFQLLDFEPHPAKSQNVQFYRCKKNKK